jgi:uncharacterized protein YkwD
MAKHRLAPARPHGRTAALAVAAGLGVSTVAGAPLVLAAPAQAAAQDIVELGPAQRQSDAQIILDELNRYRASLGVRPLKYSATLSQVVQKESDRQVTEEAFSHSTSFLQDPRTGPWTSANEVIALEYHRDVRALVRWWIASPAHDKAIKDPRHEVIGIGLSYADGSLARTGQAWQVLSTVNLYGYANGGAPADSSARVSGAPSSAPSSGSSGVAPQSTTSAAPWAAAAPQAPATDHPVVNGIGARYWELGGPAGLGQPLMAERGGLRDGGVYQDFARDGVRTTVYWSPATGAQPVKTSGAIGHRFLATGGVDGYGYPLTGEVPTTDGYYQKFSNGYTVHWSRSTQQVWATR